MTKENTKNGWIKNLTEPGVPPPLRNSVTRNRSDLVQEIISTRPGFLIQWAGLIFLFILFLLFVGSWLISYPDIVYATARISSINSPKPVVSLIDAKIIRLDAVEGQKVCKGKILGFLESNANHEDILKIEMEVDSIQYFLEVDRMDEIKKYLYKPSAQLGELQLPYQAFVEASIHFKNYLSDGFYLKKKVMLLKDLENLTHLGQNLQEQKQILELDLLLAQETFEKNKLLNKNQVISDFDYRVEESKWLNKKLTLPQINSAVITNVEQQNEKQKEILELENDIEQQKFTFRQALNTFRSQIADWKRKYLLTAPVDGKIAFASFIQSGQQLQVGEPLCFINPENTTYYAEVIIPQENLGKIEVNQKVILKFPSYPFQEYGWISGSVTFINHIPANNGYLARVSFTKGLETSYHKQIQYREGLVANTEIITKDMRLLERLYYNLIRLTRRDK